MFRKADSPKVLTKLTRMGDFGFGIGSFKATTEEGRRLREHLWAISKKPKTISILGTTYRLKVKCFDSFGEATQEKNLVWDTHMLEMFAHDYFDKLRLNRPYHLEPSKVPLAGAGTFENKDIELIWTGISQMNQQACALIDYRAFFNKLEVSGPSLNLIGRSHYWGEIWVSLDTKHIEYATLYEDVLGELKTPTQTNAQLVNVFRRGVFQKLAPFQKASK